LVSSQAEGGLSTPLLLWWLLEWLLLLLRPLL
jgi:hypothetical protein